MAKIKLNNNEYPIPDSTLSNLKADFIAYLRSIAGSGMKVVVGGVEYSVDSNKVAGAVTGLGDAFENLQSGGAPKYSIGLAFTSNGDGTCKVSGIGSCTDTDIVIPSVSPEGDSVTSIGDVAFEGSKSLTSVTIPDSVTSIGIAAFNACLNLASVIIGHGVTTIGNGAFDMCPTLADTYYAGTEEEWGAITIGVGNNNLTNATIHYNYVAE